MNILRLLLPLNKFYCGFADNAPYTPGSGGFIATDERDSVHYQKVLIAGDSGGGQGSKVSTTPGTPVQLSVTSVPCAWVKICGFEGNNDNVVIGFSSAVRAGATGGSPAGTRTGLVFTPNQSDEIRVSDLSLLYLDVVTSGDGVHFLWGVS